MEGSLKGFFEPQGVAVIGASENPDKLSHGILKNLASYGYKGQIYPVNPKAESILGFKSYPDISEVPDPVDLAVIILPASIIPGVIETCGKRGIRNATIISGGFREVGKEGRQLEDKVLQIAASYEMRLIGPNCVGTINMRTGLNTTFIKGMPATGGIGFISQSGAVCGGVVDHVINHSIGFSHLLSLGNMADVSETDMMEYLAGDSPTNIIAAYIEGIQDGRRFLQAAKRVTSRKPVVVLKAGKSEQGARAVSSHTGSLAGSHTAYEAAFRQAGVILVRSTDELLNVSMALDWLPACIGKHAVIVTNSGGPAALASDSLAENGLVLAEVSERSRQSLREKLNPAAQVENPVDMLGGADEKEYAHALNVVLADEGVDMAVAILVPQALVNPVRVAKAFIAEAKTSQKPLVACLMGSASTQEASRLLRENRIPTVDYPELVGPMLGALAAFSSRKMAGVAAGVSKLDIKVDSQEALKHFKKLASRKVFGEYETRPILEAYGIPLVEADFAKDPKDAVKAAENIGFPVAVKVVSPDVLHKSDAGGIRVGISSDGELKTAMKDIEKNIALSNPDAVIEGFLVEKMISIDQEVIIGMKRDPSFGPVMMFGLGGVFVELFKDVSFRIAPLTHADTEEMLRETRAFRLLNGWRGGPEYDTDAVIDVLLRMSVLAVDFPRIQEMEINPLAVSEKGKGALCIDCRMILGA